ncbi:hypothetical protein TSA1_18055 [Bradyrhizobium nitroreducens]|uniref:Cytochrome P450 n=1 Tax=Bradyrhizobium nitroreducens TaxID=709803 RepID=A0A2M6UNG0_9BRAD|nr:hypothetical protein TSA1_18055 [Bradyrhizobium nitroreducens]
MQRLQADYGDVTHMRIAGEHLYGIFHPTLMREVLVDHARDFTRVERIIDVIVRMQGKSLLTTEGDLWKSRRRMLQPLFSPARMGNYARLMVAAASRHLQVLISDQREVIDFEHVMTMLTMDVIMQMEFSRPAGEDAEKVERAIRYLSEVDIKRMFSVLSLPEWMPHKAEERRGRRVLNDLVWTQIQHRRAELSKGAAPREDFLGALMALRDDDGADGGLGDEEIRDQCMTMFLGGHDTTASALTWWGFAMTSNPECAQRAAAEVDDVLGGRPPAYEDIPKLEYLNRTLQETMRLYPPFAILISRRAMQPISIGPWQIPKGAAVMLSPWVVHRDARWFPDPETFDPDRFTEENSSQRPRGAFLPFGAGPRVCIGNTFALTQMSLVSAMVLQRYRFHSVATDKAADNPTYNFTLRPAAGMRLELSKR